MTSGNVYTLKISITTAAPGEGAPLERAADLVREQSLDLLRERFSRDFDIASVSCRLDLDPTFANREGFDGGDS